MQQINEKLPEPVQFGNIIFGGNVEIRYDQLLSILDVMPCGVSITTDLSCQKIIHNSEASRFLRINPGENFSHSSFKQPTVKLFRYGKEITSEEMPIQRAAWNGEEIKNDELELVWPDGVRKVASFNARPIYDATGKIIGAISTWEDITEWKKAENELERHRQGLEAKVKERTVELQAANNQLKKEIRERKKLEAKLRENEARFRVALKGSPVTVFNQDRALRYTWLYNYPYSGERVKGKTADSFLPPEENIYLKKIKQEVIETGITKRQEVELTFNQQKRYYDLYVEPLYDTCANITGITCAATDITERKQWIREMNRLEQLNLVGEMAAGIAHEIRNPLTTVRGFLQTLQGKQDFAVYNNYLKLMIEELDRANTIITEFLSLARNKTPDIKEENLNNIIESLFPLIQADAMRSNNYIEKKLENIPDIPLNEKEIRQLILNLVRNGLEAMSSGRKLTIKTYSKDEQQIILAVEDQGEGISQEVMDKIDTPFYTTKKDGTGLGMSICYGIAARHNAHIDIDTGSDGTTFYVKFKI